MVAKQNLCAKLCHQSLILGASRCWCLCRLWARGNVHAAVSPQGGSIHPFYTFSPRAPLSRRSPAQTSDPTKPGGNAHTKLHTHTFCSAKVKGQTEFGFTCMDSGLDCALPSIYSQTAEIIPGVEFRATSFRTRSPEHQIPGVLSTRSQPWAPCHRVFLFASLRPPEAVLRGDRGHRTAH